MMTERIFDTDGDKTEFYAFAIRSVPLDDGTFETVLDRTAFFPGGGGQECDTGYIGSARVIRVEQRGEEIIHFTDKEIPKELVLSCAVDHEKRLRRMQNHTGEHIISGVIHNRFGLENVGFHMGSEDVTADFDGVLTEEQMREVETEANRVVFENRRVSFSFPDEEELEKMDFRSKEGISGRIRIVSIEGCDACACCAPHVSLTGEIGLIRILGFIHYKGGIRVHMLCGLDALDRIRKDSADMKRISNLISAKIDELPEGVEKLLSSVSEMKKETAEMKKAVVEAKAEALGARNEDLFIAESGMDAEDMRRLVSLVAEKTGRLVLGVTGNDDDGYRYAVSSTKRDMRSVSKMINDTLRGRGGGTPRLAQGSVAATRVEIERFFNFLKNR